MKGLLVVGLWLASAAASAQFACPWNATMCNCSRGVHGDWELTCTSRERLELIGSIVPGRYVTLQCTNTNLSSDWESLSLVSGLQVGPVDNFSLRLCPLPGISFKELMASMGIPTVSLLQVQSYGNMSDTLTQRHLEGLHGLKKLYLDTNSLTALPEDLFNDLGNLTWLDLKNNNVLLPKGILRYVPKLEVLELGANNISYLEPGIFRNLTKLRLLNLWGNRIQNLTRATFSDVPNLESLDLNNNGLFTLPPDVFADLIKLKKVNLNGNNFNSLPQSLFRSNQQLETIQINSNRRPLKSLPPAFFENLKNLKEVMLKSCNISFLPEDLFLGCTTLENLTLEQNLMTELPEGIFHDLKELKKINLSKNKITTIPEKLFSTTHKLTILDLSRNEITNISKDTFSNLRELEILQLSHNKIKYIHSHTFEAAYNLIRLDMSHNELTDFKKMYETPFGFDSLLQSNVRLQHLDLSHNKLSTLYADWRISMTDLQVLDLSHNNFTNITVYDMQFISNSVTIDLSYNKIFLIDMDDAEKLGVDKYVEGGSPIPKNENVRVIVKGNPLKCDCRAYNLIRYLRDELEPEAMLIAKIDGAGLNCHGEPKALEGLSVEKVDPRLLVCQVAEAECPVACSCFQRPHDLGLVVDCAGRGLRQAPPSLPHSSAITNTTNHTELILSENRITRLPDVLGQGYDRVTNLDLSFNNLTSINLTAFGKNLHIIELNNNNLTRLDSPTIRMLEESKSLAAITLHNNPWTCDCQTKEFLAFLQGYFKKVPFINNITCTTGEHLAKMTSSELCPYTSLAIGIASLIVAILGLLVGSAVALYYRYQQEIKIWLYSHRLCLWLVTEEELDKDKQYDAFVSYSHQDEKFITEHLQPMLENGNPKYKLCLHYRDWVVGEFIPNQIARSVEESRRTIVVLSPNFLESVWGRMEFRTAHSQALSEGRARVIVILYGDIGPTEQLDPELNAYLSTNTYVKWGDPWFWDKLRYALPHPPELTKGIPLLSRPTSRRNGTEKLINGTAVNTAPATTPPAESLIIEPLKTLSNSKPV